jgi:hypothetical protein
MKYLDKNSLFKTIDNVSEAFLFGLAINESEKYEIADFIINQQHPGAYADTFGPTNVDLARDLVLFTGDKITSRVGKCHVIGEEASRVLRKLNLPTDKVKTALQRADSGLQNRVNDCLAKQRYNYGMYCCKSCSCALWINLASGGLNNNIALLVAGLDDLKQYRDSKGGWTGFPFPYTVYVLNEINPDIAINEMRYVAKFLEIRLKRKKNNPTKYDLRRDYIYEQILTKVNSY